MPNKIRAFLAHGKSTTTVMALALVMASFSMFAVPQKANAHAIAECKATAAHCSPTLQTCKIFEPYLAWGNPTNHKGCVAALQGFLHDYDHLYQGPMDGNFGAQTHLAVSIFQTRHPVGITVDGKVGPQTWGWIEWAATNENAAPFILNAYQSHYVY